MNSKQIGTNVTSRCCMSAQNDGHHIIQFPLELQTARSDGSYSIKHRRSDRKCDADSTADEGHGNGQVEADDHQSERPRSKSDSVVQKKPP